LRGGVKKAFCGHQIIQANPQKTYFTRSVIRFTILKVQRLKTANMREGVTELFLKLF
jgi:hypothetical protein